MSWLAGHSLDEESDNLGVDWVLQYEFGEIGKWLHEDTSRPKTDDRRPSNSDYRVSNTRGRLTRSWPSRTGAAWPRPVAISVYPGA